MNNIKKNILDLQFQKNLVIASTSAIIMLTYVIALVIGIITERINFHNLLILFFIISFSIFIIGLCSILFFRSWFHINNIPRVLRSFI